MVFPSIDIIIGTLTEALFEREIKNTHVRKNCTLNWGNLKIVNITQFLHVVARSASAPFDLVVDIFK